MHHLRGFFTCTLVWGCLACGPAEPDPPIPDAGLVVVPAERLDGGTRDAATPPQDPCELGFDEALRIGLGDLVVHVQDRGGRPLAATVLVEDTSTTAVARTDARGCAVIPWPPTRQPRPTVHVFATGHVPHSRSGGLAYAPQIIFMDAFASITETPSTGRVRGRVTGLSRVTTSTVVAKVARVSAMAPSVWSALWGELPQEDRAGHAIARNLVVDGMNLQFDEYELVFNRETFRGVYALGGVDPNPGDSASGPQFSWLGVRSATITTARLDVALTHRLNQRISVRLEAMPAHDTRGVVPMLSLPSGDSLALSPVSAPDDGETTATFEVALPELTGEFAPSSLDGSRGEYSGVAFTYPGDLSWSSWVIVREVGEANLVADRWIEPTRPFRAARHDARELVVGPKDAVDWSETYVMDENDRVVWRFDQLGAGKLRFPVPPSGFEDELRSVVRAVRHDYRAPGLLPRDFGGQFGSALEANTRAYCRSTGEVTLPGT